MRWLLSRFNSRRFNLKRFAIAAVAIGLCLQGPVRAFAPHQAEPLGLSGHLPVQLLAQEDLKDKLEDFDYWHDLCNLQADAKKYEEAMAACEQGIALEPEDAPIWADHSGVLLALKQYPEAIASAERALKFDPENSLAYTYICLSFLALENYESALDACNQALKVDGNWGRQSPALAWLNRGLILSRSKQYEQAIIAFDRVVLLEPEDSLALAYRCEALVNLKQYRKAISSCRRALAGNGHWGDKSAALAWSNQGFAHSKLKQYEAAIAAYDRAISIDPNDAITWGRQGIVLETLGNYQEALTSYDRSITLKADYSLALVGRCTMLNKLKQYKDALAACDQALEGDENWREVGPVQAWDQRGNALTGQGQYEEALASSNRAVGINPDYAEAWSNRSVTFWYLEQYDKAIASAERAIAIQPEYARAWFNKGTILRVLGEDTSAIAAYDRALKGNLGLGEETMLANIWSNRSAALWRLRRYTAALKSANAALEINPDAIQGWFNRGIALASLGRYQEAINAYDEAIKIDPENAYLWNAKGVVLLKLQQNEKALAAFSKALEIDSSYAPAQKNQEIVQERLNPKPES